MKVGSKEPDVHAGTVSFAHSGVPRVLAAAWGACLGWWVAALVVTLARADIAVVPALFGSGGAKPLEKLFYVTFYVAAVASAFLMARFAGVFRSSRSTGVGIATFVVFAAWLASTVIYGNPIAGVVPAPLSLLLMILPLACPFAIKAPAARTAVRYEGRLSLAPAPTSTRDWGLLGASFVFFAICLFPIDLQTVVARIGYNQHPVSFYIGPALFLWHRGLLPGIDFFPQYGIGIGAFFAPFLRPAAEDTVANTVLATAALSLVYFASAMVVLNKLYRSMLAAFLVVTFGLILNFHLFDVFRDPSAWPSRYPFLFLFVWLYSLAVDSKRQALTLAAAGSVAGLSLFWNTETGLYVIASALLGAPLLNRSTRTMLVNVLSIGIGVATSFIILSLIAYGPDVIQPAFFVGLLKPMTVYAGGLGAAPVAWQSPLNFIYAVISPLIGFTTIGWSAASLLACDRTFTRPSLLVLFLLALIGNCLMLKWVNMSYDALWYVNALPIIAIMAWWAQAGLSYVEQKGRANRYRVGLIALKSASVACAILFLLLIRDDRNPSKYALQAFASYPSIISGIFGHRVQQRWDSSAEPTAADLALLRRCTKAGDRVAVISQIDWVYLLAVHRAPALPWLPSPSMVYLPFLAATAMDHTGTIFIDRRTPADQLGGFGAAITQRLTSASYTQGPMGEYLRVWLVPGESGSCVS